MSAVQWYLVLVPTLWVIGVWIIAICRYNAESLRLSADIINRLKETQP